MLLLFLQWPLRDIVRGYSREANDLGQIIFALYVAVSVTAATRAGTHLAADTLAQRYSPRRATGIKQFGSALRAGALGAVRDLSPARACVLPSLDVLEAFPDTNNPGYFIIKLALWLMADRDPGAGRCSIFSARSTADDA